MMSSGASHTDRRIVDTVKAGDHESELNHGYAGHDALAGVANDTTFRQARGWMRYAVTTFDDTEVTVACTFGGSGNVPLNYDVVVEDSLIASRTFSSPSAASSVVEITVPFSLTKGKTNIAVMIRARGGLTPALRELRIIQDHYEFGPTGTVGASLFAITPSSSRSQNTFGVAR